VGHEFSGDVVQVGSLVTERGRKVIGVTAEGHIETEDASFAALEIPRLPVHEDHGVDRDGCFAEFIAMPATNVWHLDDSISYDGRASTTRMGNAFHTALTAEIPVPLS